MHRATTTKQYPEAKVRTLITQKGAFQLRERQTSVARRRDSIPSHGKRLHESVIPVRVLAVDAADDVVCAVGCAAHTVEQVGHDTILIEERFRPLTSCHSHRLARRELHLRAVRRRLGHVPRGAIGRKRVRAHGGIDTSRGRLVRIHVVQAVKIAALV